MYQFFNINDTLFYNFIVIGVHNFSGNKHIIHNNNNNCERFKYCTMYHLIILNFYNFIDINDIGFIHIK